MKNTSAALLVAALLPATCATVVTADEWTGNGASLNWSDTGNWDTANTPTTASTIYFSDVFYPNAYTNLAGLVNNIVDGHFVGGTAIYNALSAGATNHSYTTLIPGGNSLTLGGLGGAALAVGDAPGTWFSSGSATNYTTITGEGSLLINDNTAFASIGMRNRATLDSRDLATFSATVKQFLIGASADNPNASAIGGALLLGRTNTISTGANLSAPGVLIGAFPLANNTGILLLGGTNILNTDGLVVGGRRAIAGTLLAFGSTYSNTATPGTLILRGSSGGSSRVDTFSIGDMSAQLNDYAGGPAGSSTAVADFTGGTVDILANNIFVGRSAAGDVSGGGFQYGFGTLTVEHGAINANNLYIAYKQGTNGSSSLSGSSGTLPCPVTLKGDAQMTVNGDVVMAFRNNGAYGSQIPYGALIVNDSAVISVGGNITTPTNGLSLLQLGGGTVNLTGGGNLTNTTLTGQGTISGANNITVVSNLIVGGATTAGTLNLAGNLNLGTPFGLTFNLGPNATVGGGINDYLHLVGNLNLNNNPVGFTFNGPLLAGSTYHLIDFTGTKSGFVTFDNATRSAIGLNQSTAGHLDLVVTNWTPATLTWVGNTNGAVFGAAASNVWSTADTNWNNGGSPDRFYQMDDVVLDDTAVFTNIYPSGALSPGSISVNGAKSFAITNRSTAGGYAGWIQGNCPITMNGTGILTLGSYSNLTTGPIVVNNGIVRPFDPTFTTPGNNTVLGATNVPMFVTNVGSFDYNGIGSISSGKEIVIKGTGFNGRGAITNGVSNSGATMNGYFLTLAGDATVSAGVGGWGIRGLASSGAFYTGSLRLNGYTLTKLGTARFQIQDVVATDAGSIYFGGGNLSIQNSILSGAGNLVLSNNTFVQFPYAAGATSYVAKAILTTGSVGILTPASGSAISQVLVDSPVTLGGPLSITNNQSLILGGVISGDYPIDKYGNSNLVLTAANTYTGQTRINAGTLALGVSGGFDNSVNVLVNPGATLDLTAKAGGLTIAPGQTLFMNGTVVGDMTVGPASALRGNGVLNGSLTVVSNAEVAINNVNLTGTTYVSNNVTLAGGHFTWELSPSFDLSDGLVVGGNLKLTGINVFTINSIGGFDPSGTNTLITYEGTLDGGLTNLALNTEARFVIEFVDPATTPGKIQVRLITPSPLLTWKGNNATSPWNWDIQTTTNWDNGGSPDIFFQSDFVRFDDTANTNVVNLVGNIGPAGISMDNASLNYFFGGSGGLTAASLTNSGGNLTISNTANNFFTGVGLVLNGGAVTFAQPVNASLTANMIGGGTLNKSANSTLTLSGNSSAYQGAFNINAGTLRAGNSNILGTGAAVVASGGTLDLNGQFLTTQSSLSVVGAGADGWGAINNRGVGRTNALGNVTLIGNTTLGALSNAWGISGTLVGGGNTLIKTNVNDVWIQTGGETDLGDIEVRQGRLVFGQNGTTLGREANTVTVRTGGTLAFAATNAMPSSGPVLPGLNAGNKPIALQTAATLESIGFPVNQTSVNVHSGPIAITNTGVFKVGLNSQLVLNGPISGSSHLILTNNGNLALWGTNTYTSNTFVFSGTLTLANAQAVPTNSVLFVSNSISSFGNPALNLLNSQSYPTSTVLRISSANAAASVGGDGIWEGPIFLHGSNNANSITISGGQTLLDLAGPLITTNIGNVPIVFHGSYTKLRGALIAPLATVSIGVGDGLGAGFNERFTTVTFGKSNLWTGTTVIDRGRVNLGDNNVLPPSVPIRVGTLSAGVADRRIIFDLAGYNQTISSLAEIAVGDSRVSIGNSSTVRDSTLTYAGTGTNTWGVIISDTLDNPSVPRTTALTVTSGILNLVNTNTYTGPTLVTGGRLNLILGSGLTAGFVGQLGVSPVTVSGTGTLGGDGLVLGPVTNAAGGTVSPGTSIGTLRVENTVTLESGSVTWVEVNNSTDNQDLLVATGGITYGGTLVVTNLVPLVGYTNGQVLTLFASGAGYAGGFSSLVIPGVVTYDASQLTVNGSITVLQATATTPAPITTTVLGGNSLQLDWPADHTGWRLQTQTNSLSTGVTGTWYDVPGSTTVNSLTIPVVPENPTVFFRLIYP